jgi:cytochrome P450
MPDGQSAWLVTRAADVQRLFGDPRLSMDKAHAKAYVGFSLPPELDANLTNMDGDAHHRLRRIVSASFTARRVEAMASGIQSVATRLIDAFEGPSVDLVPAYTSQLPLHVISDLLGVPSADRLPFAAWTAQMFAPSHPREAAAAVSHMQAFMLDLVALRRTAPGDDLLSAIISARDEQDRMSEHELVSLAFLLLLAGVENVAHVIANGVLALLSDPSLRDPSGLPDVVEELLRHVPPLPVALRRFPVEDIDVDGVPIPAGATVYLGVMSANRDPSRFPSPDLFSPSRPAQHFTFGHGPHYCLGAPLARLETRIALSTLFTHHPDLRLATPVEDLPWRTSFRSHALKSLPVVLG